MPLLPILGLFRDYFSVTDGDHPPQVRAAVEERLRGVGADLGPDLALIFDFLEVPDPDRPIPQMSPDVRRRRVLDIIRRISQLRSEHATLLLILEDLHWFDPQSVEFLDAWFPSFPGTRTLIVTNFRPEFHAPWMARSYYHQVPLTPLDNAAVADLLHELLGPDPGLAPVAQALLLRSAGNPFFAEEIVRGLEADGSLIGAPGAYRRSPDAGAVKVPPTVQAVLASRIDLLDTRAKTTLQAASVIGRTFTVGLLLSVTTTSENDTSDALQRLCAAELLQATSIADEYRFWHPLTQEVTYGTLLTATRRSQHAKVAAALIAGAPQRHDELAALIATHYEDAADDLEAGRWQLRAATRASRADVNDAGRRLLASIAHLDAVPETPETLALGVHARCLLLRVGARAGLDAEQAAQIAAQARVAAQTAGAADQLVGIWMADGVFRFFTGDVGGGHASMVQAGLIADTSDDPGLSAWSYCSGGISFAYTGPLLEGIGRVERGFALCQGDPSFGSTHSGYSVHDSGIWIRGLMYTLVGRIDEGRQLLASALDAYARRPTIDWRLWVLTLYVHLADSSGIPDDVEIGHAFVPEMKSLAENAGSALGRVKFLQAVGVISLLRQDPQHARTVLEEALGTARRQRSGLLEEPSVLCHLARAHCAVGDHDIAATRAAEATRIARTQGSRVVECFGHLVHARILRESATEESDYTAAREAVTAGERLAAAVDAHTYAAFLAEERARLDGDEGALKACAEGYAAIGATGHARRLQDELAAR